MPPKFSYATQRNTPCQTNAQKWYFIKAIKEYKNASNQTTYIQSKSLVNYYLNGNLPNVINIKNKNNGKFPNNRFF